MAGYAISSFGGNPIAGYIVIIAAKFDPSGNVLWTAQDRTPGIDFSHAIASDPGGDFYVTGQTFDSLDGNPRMGAGDFFVVKYDPKRQPPLDAPARDAERRRRRSRHRRGWAWAASS